MKFVLFALAALLIISYLFDRHCRRRFGCSVILSRDTRMLAIFYVCLTSFAAFCFMRGELYEPSSHGIVQTTPVLSAMSKSLRAQGLHREGRSVKQMIQEGKECKDAGYLVVGVSSLVALGLLRRNTRRVGVLYGIAGTILQTLVLFVAGMSVIAAMFAVILLICAAKGTSRGLKEQVYNNSPFRNV